MIQPSTLSFLKALKKNNNKPWFDAHKEKYLDAKKDFESFVAILLEKMISFDADLKDQEAKKCMFRINRDIRFSKNKTPYKINISASFNKGGKKSINAGYYFHLQPGGNSFAGGGIWTPAAPELKKIRQEIDYSFAEFKNIISNPSFQKEYGELERTPDQLLINVPRGYEKENVAADYLKLKSFLATKNISDASLLMPGLADEIAYTFKALTPLVKFINRAFE